jgi:hypothetical protein
MAGALLNLTRPLIVPREPGAPLDRTVAENFERFDGLGVLESPHVGEPVAARGSTADYGWDRPGGSPRPGRTNQPLGQVYSDGPLIGLTNTLGGQPLPVHDWRFRVQGYTRANTPNLQHRLGDGQNFQGVAQTVQLADLINNPPAADPLDQILGVYG